MRFFGQMAFGDADSHAAYYDKCMAAASAQRVRWAVPPDQTLTTSMGHILHAGEEVTVEHYANAMALEAGGHPLAMITRLVRSGHILEATSHAWKNEGAG